MTTQTVPQEYKFTAQQAGTPSLEYACVHMLNAETAVCMQSQHDAFAAAVHVIDHL